MLPTPATPQQAAPPDALALVCIARRDDASGLEPAGALEGARLVHVGPLTAVALPAREADFTGPEGERNLADVEWLAPRAARHESLIHAARAACGGPDAGLIPVRFGALFRDELSLAHSLLARSETLLRTIDHLAGRDEWSLRVLASREPSSGRVGVTARDGASYLRQRSAAHASRQGADAAQREHAAAVLDQALRGVADRRPARRGHKTTEGLEVLAAAAALVEHADARAWAQHAEAQAAAASHAGLTLTVSGPWPPYSFCPPADDQP